MKKNITLSCLAVILSASLLGGCWKKKEKAAEAEKEMMKEEKVEKAEKEIFNEEKSEKEAEKKEEKAVEEAVKAEKESKEKGHNDKISFGFDHIKSKGNDFI
jgi:biopolymer transport protein ExbB/TolQ